MTVGSAYLPADDELCMLDANEALRRFGAGTLSPVELLEAITDRVMVLYEGKVEALGPIAEVRQKARGWVKDYFSGPRGRAAQAGHAAGKQQAGA